MVYLSETASLTMLETLVHIHAPQLLDDFTLLSLDVPDDQIQTFDMSRLLITGRVRMLLLSWRSTVITGLKAVLLSRCVFQVRCLRLNLTTC